jgi:hypothetical protein
LYLVLSSWLAAFATEGHRLKNSLQSSVFSLQDFTTWLRYSASREASLKPATARQADFADEHRFKIIHSTFIISDIPAFHHPDVHVQKGRGKVPISPFIFSLSEIITRNRCEWMFYLCLCRHGPLWSVGS